MCILLIPRFGIAGAATASLLTMVLNAVLSYWMLKSSVSIRIDSKSVLNLVVSAGIMSIVLSAYLYVLPVRDFIGLVLVLALGAAIYFSSVLWTDRTIRNDLKNVLDTMNFPFIPKGSD
jgi:O-antigen/teichoic acid export membrane protein